MKYLMAFRIYYERIPPHLWFRPEEIAVWRNFAACSSAEEIAFPGPADWWAGYDAAKHGFDVPDGDPCEFSRACVFEDLLIGIETPRHIL